MDNVSKETRSWIMARVKSVDSKAELLVRSRLHRMGFRFNLHDRKLAGKPDVSLPKLRLCLFVHGCFWHRHKCGRATTPTSNVSYWSKKFIRNVQRFKEVRKSLRDSGWRVLVLWECQAESSEKIDDWLKKNLKPLK